MLQQYQKVVEFLESQVALKKFTAWSFATPKGQLSAFYADEITPPLEGNCNWVESLHPIFDLASLTKPLFGNGILRFLLQNDYSTIINPLIGMVYNTNISLLDIINHSAGLPAWTWFGKGLNPPKEMQNILTQFILSKLANKATDTVYSDLGFFLLARIIESFTANYSADFWLNTLTNYNEMLGSNFLHASINGNKVQRAVPAYPYYALQDKTVPESLLTQNSFGLVHDTNANILAQTGVVSCHAGLFGNIVDVVKAIPFLSHTQNALLQEFSKHNASPRFSFGLDTPMNSDSLACPLVWPMPENEQIFGHLGYTGTAFWFRNYQGVLHDFHALLTNRTSARTCLGATKVPRIFVASNATEAVEEAFMLSETGKFHKISNNDAEEIIVAHARSTNLLWNKNIISQPPNIGEIRKQVARMLWSK